MTRSDKRGKGWTPVRSDGPGRGQQGATATHGAYFHPAQIAVERFYLLYTPLWTACVALVLALGAFARWGDGEYMVFGIALGAPIWLLPLVTERHLPPLSRHSFQTALFITLLSFLQNYFGTPFFARCFGLEYHFPTRWNLNGYPVFLSFMTIAYFATYFAVMHAGLRIVETWGSAAGAGGSALAGRLRRVGVTFVLACALALAETATMATPLMRGYFAYADKGRMLTVGSLCYGTLLFLSQLCFLRIRPGRRGDDAGGAAGAVWDALAVSMAVLAAYELYAFLLGRGLL